MQWEMTRRKESVHKLCPSHPIAFRIKYENFMAMLDEYDKMKYNCYWMKGFSYLQGGGEQMKREHASRLGKLQESVARNKLDAYVVTSQESIYYLAGASYKPLERPFFIIVRPSGSPMLLVPELEKEHMRKAEGFEAVESYWEYPARTGCGWREKLLGLLEGSSAVGIEPSASVGIAAGLEGKDVKALPLVDERRLVKSEREVAAIRTAALYADYGMKLMCGSLYRGATPLELFSLSRKIQTRLIIGGEYDPLASEFLTACWPAPFSAQPHSIPALNAAAGEGPIVLMSFLRANGYAAECERTVFLSEPDSDAKDAFHHMTEARKLAFGMLKPGADCSEIDSAAKGYLENKGFGKYLLHRVGHGIGLGNHEGPWLSEGSEHRLQANMVVSIEPGIYIPGVGGFRHSDTVLVTASGYECLTKVPVELEKLIFRKANLIKRARGAVIRKVLKQ